MSLSHADAGVCRLRKCPYSPAPSLVLRIEHRPQHTLRPRRKKRPEPCLFHHRVGESRSFDVERTRRQSAVAGRIDESDAGPGQDLGGSRRHVRGHDHGVVSAVLRPQLLQFQSQELRLLRPQRPAPADHEPDVAIPIVELDFNSLHTNSRRGFSVSGNHRTYDRHLPQQSVQKVQRPRGITFHVHDIIMFTTS